MPLPRPARDDVDALLAPLRASRDAERVRWVRTEGLHLTIRFLGSTPADRATAVADVVSDSVLGVMPFRVRLAGGGAFPSASRPRVLWLGITEGAAGLAELAARVAEPLAALGWPPEDRPFKAHLTVARTDAVPLAIGGRVAAALTERAASWSTGFEAAQLTLFRSVLGGGPARYEPLLEARFGGTVGE